MSLVPEPLRTAAFFATFLALFFLTLLCLLVYAAAWRLFPRASWAAWIFVCPLLGVAYITIGLKHFVVIDASFATALTAIVPPNGTWGFWYIPGDATFHVMWTGVAEVLGGAGLVLSAALRALGWLRSGWLRRLSSRSLLALTLAVTPANVYMLTHGALLPGVTDEFSGEKPIPLSIHAARLSAQALLLSALHSLGRAPDSTAVRDKAV